MFLNKNGPKLADLLTLDEKGFRELFAGSPVKRIGVKRFLRNCLIAAGNSGDVRLLTRVKPLVKDDDPVVADAAVWALERLTPPRRSLRCTPPDRSGRRSGDECRYK